MIDCSPTEQQKDIHEILERFTVTVDSKELLDFVKNARAYRADISLIVEFASHCALHSSVGIMIALGPVLEEILIKHVILLTGKEVLLTRRLLDGNNA
jgi:hypothetical protein